jgi:hypothetical protein
MSSKPLYEARERNAPVDSRIGVNHDSMYATADAPSETFTSVELIGPGMRDRYGDGLRCADDAYPQRSRR